MFRQLRLSLNSTWTRLGLARTKLRLCGNIFFKNLIDIGLSSDCLQTVLRLLGLSSDSMDCSDCPRSPCGMGGAEYSTG